MHANLNTYLFYDLVLLIEFSNWKTTPTLNAQIADSAYRVSLSPKMRIIMFLFI